jgi:hypothetical protein
MAEKTKEELETERKAKEEADKKKADEAKLSEEEKKIAELMKDPDAVATLLAAKRAANEEAKKLRLKLEEIEKAQKAADDKALQEQGKFKELAEKAKTEADAMKTSFKSRRIDFELRLEAVREGIVDPEDAVLLCDRAQIAVSDDFSTVTGAKDAVAALKKAKAYLFGKGADKGIPPPGTGMPSPRGVVLAGEDKISPEQRLSNYFAGKKK